MISQKTEDLVGPYELHDFFLYYMLRVTYEPKKLYRVAKYAFQGQYDSAVILKWLKTFTGDFLPSSSSAPACRTGRKWEVLRCLPGEI